MKVKYEFMKISEFIRFDCFKVYNNFFKGMFVAVDWTVEHPKWKRPGSCGHARISYSVNAMH